MSAELDRLREALAPRYELEREVGRGAMAGVYLAREMPHRRAVAIKVFDPALSNQLGRKRFVREVETVARLNHPNIVPIFAAGEADGLLYYVMPFVDGFTVRHHLMRSGPWDVRAALQVGRDAAAALAHAHARGIVHRDVKPENILLADGQAVVADFGIAKAVETAGGESLTRTGLVIGTPRYMSPEQAAGAAVDGRADVYALGRVVFEMLTGDVPPDDHHRLPQALARVPPPAAAVLERALAPAITDRYQSARELRDAFDTARDGVPPAASVEARSRRATLIVAAVLLALVIVLAVIARVAGW